MIRFFRKLFGLARFHDPPELAHRRYENAPANKPPLPEDIASEFMDWYEAQRAPAILLTPDDTSEPDELGSRLFGPAWLAAGEGWPSDPEGTPLELIAQLNLAELPPLPPVPQTGLLQFFIARDDHFGADFDDPAKGRFLVRHVLPGHDGALHAPPPLALEPGRPFSDLSPVQSAESRTRGVALVAEPIDDRIDLSNKDASDRFYAISGEDCDMDVLYAQVDDADAERPLRHHVGGFPAFTQNDIRYMPAYADYDFTLLRLTSDEYLQWGDVGECVFMIRSEDLVKGDFSRVAYSWDCH